MQTSPTLTLDRTLDWTLRLVGTAIILFSVLFLYRSLGSTIFLSMTTLLGILCCAASWIPLTETAEDHAQGSNQRGYQPIQH